MNSAFRIDADRLNTMMGLLRRKGYEVIGPRLSNDAIVYDKVESTDDLPVGIEDEQTPGSYRLAEGDSNRMFGYTLAPQSWKRYLYPPQRKLFSIRKDGKSMEIVNESDETPMYAFLGVRACELGAIEIQDKVFRTGEYKDDGYLNARRNNLIIAVNCGRAGENCFCTSMGTGPKAEKGYDIALTEILTDGEHYFVAEEGSEAGASLLEEINAGQASETELEAAGKVVAETSSMIGKKMETSGLDRLLSEHTDHPEWDAVAKRCLTCGNCTMVCPTCFCSTVIDETDLPGSTASRSRRWDSCFTMEFAKVSGGNFRISPKSRYRQWMTHKLSSWVEQFGVSGCVGCGRCITWCPVGIDITEEVRAIRGEVVKQENGG